MVTTTQALSIRRESRLKGFNKDNIKERLQFKTTKHEPTDCSKVLVKADEHLTLAQVDLETQKGDLIDSKFVDLYHMLTRPSEKKTLASAIKGSQGMIDKRMYYPIRLDWILGRRYFLYRTPLRMGHDPRRASFECCKSSNFSF